MKQISLILVAIYLNTQNMKEKENPRRELKYYPLCYFCGTHSKYLERKSKSQKRIERERNGIFCGIGFIHSIKKERVNPRRRIEKIIYITFLLFLEA